jgi:hypothetical protein
MSSGRSRHESIHFGRESFDVLRFLLDEAHRDEQREARVLVARGLEASIEVGLDLFPDRVAVRPDHHAALDDARGLGELRLRDDVLVPLGVILRARSDA